MPRPRGPKRTTITIAPRSEVVDAVRGYAKGLGVPQGHTWELGARKLLNSKGVKIGPPIIVTDPPKKKRKSK